MADYPKERQIFNSIGGGRAVDSRAYMALKGGYNRNLPVLQVKVKLRRLERFWLSKRLKSRAILEESGFKNLNYFSKQEWQNIFPP